MSIYIGDKEIKNLYVGESAEDYSAMRGPCNEGYHVPTKDEWTNIVTIWTSLGGGSSDGTNFGIALKLPFAGQRPGNNGNINAQGTVGKYRCSMYSDTDSTRAYYLYNDSASISVSTNNKYGGFSIRAFKDSPVIPTNSWSKLYGTSIEAGGIFWSSTDGLISLSSDGSSWITISDKNLGATTVWSSGNTLSQNNCGKYYQRGNNYGFPFTGSITTSGTQVNASAYGPGNYYSSSTFIYRTSSPYNWDSSDNNNLRGGETGITEKGAVKAVYLGENKVRPSGPDKDYLCFTAEQANSTVKLNKSGSPTAVNLETSTDGLTWTGYTIGSTLTLSAVGDKIYFRNTSETTTGFSTRSNAYYQFVMTGSIAASGDITSLINKNLTTTLVGSSCFYNLFADCSSLTKCPKLPATTLTKSCYYWMFNYCSNLETLPALPATNISAVAYYGMFTRCSKIKLSTTQTGEYQTPYRIPTEGTGTKGSEATDYMFDYTGGTFIGSGRSRQAGINTTYYTSNTVA